MEAVTTMDDRMTEAWRREVSEFLDDELPQKYARDIEYSEDEDLWAFAWEFTRKVGAKGWLGLTWPVEYGGLGRSAVEQFIVREECARRNAPLLNHVGWGLAAGTLLIGGTHEQKLRFLPPIARMETLWAEGFSEPDAGSDLASLTTSGVRDGDDWIINGQKTYTTWGTHADVLFLAARTSRGERKQEGISIFCLDLSLPGVTFAPMWNIGRGLQNQTFLDNVRISNDMMIGEEGKGWEYIMRYFYGAPPTSLVHARVEGMVDDVVAYMTGAQRGDGLLIDDPCARHRLGELMLLAEAQRLLAYQRLYDVENARRALYGGAVNAVVIKEAKPRFAQLVHEIVGPESQIGAHSPDAPMAGEAEAWYLEGFGNHAGGTSQVKRMVLATKGLGLPR